MALSSGGQACGQLGSAVVPVHQEGTEGGQDEEVSEARRDLATAVTSALAVRAGVWAVRVHDVSATRDALAVAHAWEG